MYIKTHLDNNLSTLSNFHLRLTYDSGLFRSRRGSTTGPPRRDLMLEHKISKWIISLDGQSASLSSSSSPGDFGGWLEDGSVLSG